jgi:hypothetical protein
MRQTLISAILAHGRAVFNENLDFSVGSSKRGAGAEILLDDIAVSDLQINCGQSECPSVLIFGGQQ